MIKLKENERLVYAGKTALISPSGKPLPAVPQYIVVPADEADPALVVELKENEALIIIGSEHTDREAAEKLLRTE